MASRGTRQTYSMLLISAATQALVIVSDVRAESYYTWNGAGAAWTSSANWSAGGPPTSTDFAQFISPSRPANPVLNSAASIAQMTQLGSPLAGFNLTGSGSLTAGIHDGYDGNGILQGRTGIMTWADSGDLRIDLGAGTGPSLLLGGAPTYGQVDLSYGSRLILTGNTVATLNNTPVVSNPTTGTTSVPQTILRGGTLVLDNSAGNPTGGQRLSGGSVGLSMYGAGSAIEFRGAASGTAFSGFSSGCNLGGGDGYIRMVQNGSGALSAAFPSITRATSRHFLFFENIGTGFVGDAGKPTITSAGAASNFSVTQTFGGVISSSPSIGAPWTMVTNRASDTPSAVVTGRWANYNNGIVASTTTNYTGDFSGATANANVLFAPASPGATTLSATTNQLSSVVFEPAVSGASLNLGGNTIKTLSVALSGANDLTVSGGNLLQDDATAGGRNLVVLNPTTSLITNSSLANAANSSILIGGKGFVVLNGTTNQIPFTAPQNIYLNEGVLRVTTSNFVPTNSAISFRGGTLEYDVSAASAAATFNVAGGGSGNVVFNIFTAGEATSTDVGGGGFSAYAGPGNGNGNTLTVNLGGASSQLTWAANFFMPSFYALKFGSLKSNATVVFQNPLNLGTGVPTANGINRNRLIEVTGGVGNAADKTQMTGVISGDAGYDLVKSGGGVLETTAANTYNGNTVVNAGELRIKGGYSGSGSYCVNGGNLLITQSAWNPVTSGSGAVVNQGKLIFDYTGTSSPFSLLRPLLAASSATGFTSGQFKSALADASIGLGSKDDGVSRFTVQAAYYGDADLNGKVNTTDFNQLAGGFGGAGQWSQGNFNYDLTVDSIDFNLLVNNYGKSVPIGGSLPMSAASIGSVVPEPSLLGLLAILGTARLMQRRAMK